MRGSYDPSALESKWQKKWEEAKVYEVDLKGAQKPYYTHVMFPYPSGDKLHVGHWYNFGPADSFARFMRMRGHDVFSPMGFDAFGLPAENYAVKTGIHPAKSTSENVATMIRQLKRIGCMYDWEKMVNTSTPEYYRWTQWLFLQMFEKGLAYRKEGLVNFCPSCQTVLANEQVHEGRCDRCETEVVQKPLTQWYWKITDYSQRLLDNLHALDWPEKTKTMQRNWIGRKEGINI
ncbi:MAG: class I tRNA ligase family protein, partial [Patescibacteria group bacterium]